MGLWSSIIMTRKNKCPTDELHMICFTISFIIVVVLAFLFPIIMMVLK